MRVTYPLSWTCNGIARSDYIRSQTGNRAYTSYASPSPFKGAKICILKESLFCCDEGRDKERKMSTAGFGSDMLISEPFASARPDPIEKSVACTDHRATTATENRHSWWIFSDFKNILSLPRVVCLSRGAVGNQVLVMELSLKKSIWGKLSLTLMGFAG